MKYSFVVPLVALVVILGGCVQTQPISNTVEPSTTTDVPPTIASGSAASDWCNPEVIISLKVDGKIVSPIIQGWAEFEGKSFCKGYVNNTPPGHLDGGTTTYYFNEDHSEIYFVASGWPNNYSMTHIVNGTVVFTINNYFEDFAIDCVTFIPNREYVINSETEYNEQILVADINSNPSVIIYNGLEGCKNYKFPMPDFSTKTLLGLATGSTGCDQFVSKNIYIDSTAKKYTYEVNITEMGSCEPFVMNNNWITVDKIPSDYTVEFKVEKTKK